jgi:hypothetical protein
MTAPGTPIQPIEKELDRMPADELFAVADFHIIRCAGGQAECLGNIGDRTHQKPAAVVKADGRPAVLMNQDITYG